MVPERIKNKEYKFKKKERNFNKPDTWWWKLKVFPFDSGMIQKCSQTSFLLEHCAGTYCQTSKSKSWNAMK